MRWNKRYDGTKASLVDRSHRPHIPHPNAHTEKELSNIHHLIRRNPQFTLCELFGKLRTRYGYTRHLVSLYRVLRKIGHFKQADKKKEKYIL